ncbi:hypothetical protein BGZ96_002363 [Linnemannia gamsii]|uniref:Uncharacterized protein n=1 Tax=Linnemannia gamsii TaxID=64522 RepID=A0ABQ7JKP5_9FUNG|nr:hypothetical protein BGZ96_002363 [Linnemannia gamsii]
MSHQKEDQAPVFNSNVYGAYNNDDDDMNMSSSIVSFGDPNLDEIALQMVFLAIHLVMDNGVQDDSDDDYDFVDDHEELFMPDVFESFDEPDLDEIAWQVIPLVLSNDRGQPR